MKPETNEKVDRRVQRTRQLLSGALMSLIVEKGYDAITVQNIIDRANLGRSTFYAHYQDKEDLLLRGMENIVHSLIGDENVARRDEGDEGDEETPRILSAVLIFQHAKEQHSLHKAMVGGRGIDVIIKTIQTHLSQHVEERIQELLPEGQTPSVPTQITANYLAGTMLTLLTWWLDNNMPYSPERMDEIFQELAMPGVWATIGVTP
ncbi:TetR/AcrR family transcriptional regulator [Anaerolineales bacterium HSG24]|nr:TetR/AcrR family transcriptional regulator [Anaerolineales bacterium HSG24]